MADKKPAPNYRATPTAWALFLLYGRQHVAPHAAYWPSKHDPDRPALTPGGNPVGSW